VLLGDRELLFFGGKGGVGKTTLATAVALVSADEGARTLLVSTDPAHSTGDVLDTNLGPEPRSVETNLWAMEIDPVLEADRYIADVKARIADVTNPRLAAEVERQIDIARVTPGAEEAALFDRFTKLIDQLGATYDRVIFDTAPLGHTLRLLALPEQLTLWISGLIGRRRKVNVMMRMWRSVAGAAAGDRLDRDDPVLAALMERKARFERAREKVTDRNRTAFVFVVIPERLPVLETQRSIEILDRHGIPVGGVVVNRVSAAGRADDYTDTISRSFAAHPIFHVPQVDGVLHGMEPLRGLAGRISRPTLGA
jgi:arsenite-transporting ATPase